MPLPSWESACPLPLLDPDSQIPRIASAGIAMIPNKRSDDYSRSEIRAKALWMELSEPVADERDAYFGRGRWHAPDPLLALSGPGAKDIGNEQRETGLLETQSVFERLCQAKLTILRA